MRLLQTVCAAAMALSFASAAFPAMAQQTTTSSPQTNAAPAQPASSAQSKKDAKTEKKNSNIYARGSNNGGIHDTSKKSTLTGPGSSDGKTSSGLPAGGATGGMSGGSGSTR